MVSDNGCVLGVAGRAGFALYSTMRHKWKLFGNEVQEQGLVCQGGGHHLPLQGHGQEGGGEGT